MRVRIVSASVRNRSTSARETISVTG